MIIDFLSSILGSEIGGDSEVIQFNGGETV